MTTQAEYKEQVRKDWTDNATPWRKWHSKLVRQTAAVTAAIVEAAKLAPGMKVLDLASGTGEPAFSLARAVGPSGLVTATDLVPEMLDIIRDVMREDGVNNVAVEVADMEQLSHPAASFDRVTSRFGVMFAPDPVRAAREMRRVLVPGGRVVLAVWGPPTSSMWTTMLGPFMKRAALPPPPPDAPNPLRFAKPGSISAALTEAGFTDVEEETSTVPLTWPGPAAEAFQMQTELVPQPFARFRAAMAPADFDAALAEMKESCVAHERNGAVYLEGIIHVAAATA